MPRHATCPLACGLPTRPPLFRSGLLTRPLFLSLAALSLLTAAAGAQTVDQLIQTAQQKLDKQTRLAAELEKQLPGIQKVTQALERTVTVDFTDTPLQDVVTFISNVAAVNMTLDKAAVPAEGAFITLKVKNIPLKTALDFILKQARLRRVIRDGALFISSETGLQGVRAAQIYDVADLLDAVERHPGAALGRAEKRDKPVDRGLTSAARDLVGLVVSTADAPSWGAAFVNGESIPLPEAAQGDGIIGYREGRLTVLQTYEAHDEVQGTLNLLRRQAATVVLSESARKIRDALDKPVTLDFAHTPIVDAITFIADFAAVNIVLDKNAVPARVPITLKVKDLSLKAALALILHQAQLDYAVLNEALYISNAEGLGEAPRPRARDLAYALPAAGTEDVAKRLAAERDRRRRIVEKIRAALEKPVTLNFADTPFQDAITFIQDFAAVNMVLDPSALPREDGAITLRVKDIPLKPALDFIFMQVRLKSAIWNEVLFISDDAWLAAREKEAADLLREAREALEAGQYVKALDLLETLRIEYSDTQACREKM